MKFQDIAHWNWNMCLYLSLKSASDSEFFPTISKLWEIFFNPKLYKKDKLSKELTPLIRAQTFCTEGVRKLESWM